MVFLASAYVWPTTSGAATATPALNEIVAATPAAAPKRTTRDFMRARPPSRRFAAAGHPGSPIARADTTATHGGAWGRCDTPRENLNVTGGHRYIECNHQIQITGRCHVARSDRSPAAARARARR